MSYLSPRIQNELTLLSAHIVRGKLIHELIDKRLFCSLLANETSDISGRKQLSISVRYVSSTPDSEGQFIHGVLEFYSFGKPYHDRRGHQDMRVLEKR